MARETRTREESRLAILRYLSLRWTHNLRTILTVPSNIPNQRSRRLSEWFVLPLLAPWMNWSSAIWSSAIVFARATIVDARCISSPLLAWMSSGMPMNGDLR